jgi:hypothetical protein
MDSETRRQQPHIRFYNLSTKNQRIQMTTDHTEVGLVGAWIYMSHMPHASYAPHLFRD